jgi:hypothetical protein
MGAWPVKDQRQPIVSARKPPTGPPRQRPIVAARLRPACHAAISRSGTRSAVCLEEASTTPNGSSGLELAYPILREQ